MTKPVNLLTNGGFEQIGSDGLPVGWTLRCGSGADWHGQEIHYRSDPNVLHSGKRSASVLHESPNFAEWLLLTHELSLPPGDYVFTGYVYWKGVSPARPCVSVQVMHKDGSASPSAFYQIFSKPTPPTWQRFTYRFTVTANDDRVQFMPISTDGVCYVFVDDVAVYRASEAPVLKDDIPEPSPKIPAVMGHKLITGLTHNQRSRVQNIDGIWYLVNPNGEAFFDLGITHVSYPAAGSWWDQLNPQRGKLVREKWPSSRLWMEQVAAQMKRWGFSSFGAWSYSEALPAAARNGLGYWAIPGFSGAGEGKHYLRSQTGAEIPIGGTSRMADPFDPVWRKAVLEIARAYAEKTPSLTGYFVDNEISLGVVPLQHYLWTPSARKEMAEWLTKRYKGQIEKLNRAWSIPISVRRYSSFVEATMNPPVINLDQNPAGYMDDLKLFEDYTVQTYVDVVISAIRRYDPDGLIASPRLPGSHFTDYAPLRHFRRFDIISINDYAGQYYTKSDLERLKAIHKLTGRPILISEWAADGKQPGSQEGRAEAYQNQLKQLTNLPFIVGAHYHMWFTSGNGQGTGIVHGADDPDQPFVSQIAKINIASFRNPKR